jgi:hypothetical protein
METGQQADAMFWQMNSDNLEKIAHHGGRAASIVKNMFTFKTK